jgi:hypothetical protein
VHYLKGQGLFLDLTPLPRPHNRLRVKFTLRKNYSFIINIIKQDIDSMGSVSELRGLSESEIAHRGDAKNCPAHIKSSCISDGCLTVVK